MTQDVYMGRNAKNPGAATALELAFTESVEDKTMGWRDTESQVRLLPQGFVGIDGFEPTTREFP